MDVKYRDLGMDSKKDEAGVPGGIAPPQYVDQDVTAWYRDETGVPGGISPPQYEFQERDILTLRLAIDDTDGSFKNVAIPRSTKRFRVVLFRKHKKEVEAAVEASAEKSQTPLPRMNVEVTPLYKTEVVCAAWAVTVSLAEKFLSNNERLPTMNLIKIPPAAAFLMLGLRLTS
jgi:hypothetical protein